MLLANPPGLSLPEHDRDVFVNAVSPDWFKTYATPFVAGRDFTLRDTASAPPVAIVNETFAKRFFPGGNAIGQATRFESFPDDTRPSMQIVAIARDAVYENPRDPVRPTVYIPVAQMSARSIDNGLTLAARAGGGRPELLTRGVIDATRRVNGDLTLTVQPMMDNVRDALTEERLLAIISVFFGGLALLLAGLGLYGVMSYAVSRRRTEIGIRMALGAGPAGAVRLILLRVAALVGLGVMVGAAVALWAARFVSTLLFGLPPRDPTTLVAAALLLAGVGAFAGWLPARRASRVDPAEVLRT